VKAGAGLLFVRVAGQALLERMGRRGIQAVREPTGERDLSPRIEFGLVFARLGKNAIEAQGPHGKRLVAIE
jgi:hypothetical protein